MATKNALIVYSCNVRGMRDHKKRMAIYNWLKEKKCDIYLLQETHCHLKKDEVSWAKEWGGQSYWSKGTARSKGVAVLFNENIKYDIKDSLIDANGRYIRINVKCAESLHRIINVYAPNNEFERVNFFRWP